MPEPIIIGRDESDKKRFGKEGLIYLGKHYVKMGQSTSLSNQILVDVARSHVILICGKRGSGKSHSLGVFAEEITSLAPEISQNISVVLFDTMGIFWTMKYKNEKDEELLDKWGLDQKKLPVRVLVPFGYEKEYIEKTIPIDGTFALNVQDIAADEWVLTFGLNYIDPIAIIIERNITELENSGKSFDIEDIIRTIRGDKLGQKEDKEAAMSFFEAAETWGVFAKKKQKATSFSDLAYPGRTTIIDLSVYNSIGSFNVRALVIGLVSKKLFNQRMAARKHEEVLAVRKGMDYLNYKEKREMPLVWIMIDEVHEFMSQNQKSAATDALIQILREGRQPGLSLVMATQQPGQLHKDVLTQADIVLAHRVTAKPDVDALNQMMQTYLAKDIQVYLDNLPKLKGSAIILDDNSERIYPMRVRPRYTWHGGEAPTSIRIKKRL
ncbi:MAG: DUF87 domain-containing protein [archaeon]